jgi:hypothetical protein
MEILERGRIAGPENPATFSIQLMESCVSCRFLNAECTRSHTRALGEIFSVRAGGKWLRGLDSNQDNQLQRLACYQLHYPG